MKKRQTIIFIALSVVAILCNARFYVAYAHFSKPSLVQVLHVNVVKCAQQMQPKDSSMENNSSSGKKNSGRLIQWIGLGVMIGALINSIRGYIDIASDASTRAFAFLVFIEGGFFILIGLGMVWIGHRMHKKNLNQD